MSSPKVIPFRMAAPIASAFQLQADGSIFLNFPSTGIDQVVEWFDEHARAMRDMARIFHEQESAEKAAAEAAESERAKQAILAAEQVVQPVIQEKSREELLRENQALRDALAQAHGKGTPPPAV